MSEMREEALSQLRALDANICVCETVPYHPDEAAAAARELYSRDVDLAVAMARAVFPVLEGLSADHSLPRIESLARCAAAAKRVRRSASGVLGTPNLGMLDIAYDESLVAELR